MISFIKFTSVAIIFGLAGFLICRSKIKNKKTILISLTVSGSLDESKAAIIDENGKETDAEIYEPNDSGFVFVYLENYEQGKYSVAIDGDIINIK